jgi:hypothetical protein
LSSKTLKFIAISAKNYERLKDLGKAGDSFNDVLTVILNNGRSLTEGAKLDD